MLSRVPAPEFQIADARVALGDPWVDLEAWDARNETTGTEAPSTGEVPSEDERSDSAPFTAESEAITEDESVRSPPPPRPTQYGPRRLNPGYWGLEPPPASVPQGNLDDGLRALNDSLASLEAEPAWGGRDETGGRWGISSGRLYLGSFSIPLRTDDQPIFSDPLDARQRLDGVLDDRARIRGVLEDRAKAVRRRNDSIRSRTKR